MHATLLVLLPTFAALFWWQVQRVREGNTLSWAYVFEWPFFAGYAVYIWWKLVHDQADAPAPARRSLTATTGATAAEGDQGGQADTASAAGTGVGGRDVQGEEEDEELAAYNRYLAELNASGRRKRW